MKENLRVSKDDMRMKTMKRIFFCVFRKQPARSGSGGVVTNIKYEIEFVGSIGIRHSQTRELRDSCRKKNTGIQNNTRPVTNPIPTYLFRCQITHVRIARMLSAINMPVPS